MTGMPHPQSLPTLKILCVDDEPDIRAVLEMALRMDLQIEVRSAGSGTEALSMLGLDGGLPDLALLDMMMPEMNGYELATALRSVDYAANIAIIFVSANDRPADIARYRSVGALGFIRKPFDPMSLAKLVRGHMSGAITSLDEE
jgi:two-component system, OmpR family, response regulator